MSRATGLIKGLNLISTAGLFLIVGGIVGIALGGYLYLKANAGLKSLDAVYAAQRQMMTYDADGNFTDRGTREGGDAVLGLLENDWKYPVNRANLDPNDPLVNTPDELMVKFATINYHTLNGTQTVVLDKDVEYKGQLYKAGTYQVPVDGRYFSQLDRSHPLEGKVRDQAWSPLAFGLLGNLIGGVNADYQAGMAHFMSWSIFVGLGFMFTVAGVFLTVGGIQLARKVEVEVARLVNERAPAAVQPTPAPSPAGAD
jgi:hypothetical protein